MAKIWLDDIMEAPEGFIGCISVNGAKAAIERLEAEYKPIELISCDHDLGDFACDGGDGIKLLDWLVERKTLYPVELHTMNVVGRENMQRIIDRFWRVSTNK